MKRLSLAAALCFILLAIPLSHGQEEPQVTTQQKQLARAVLKQLDKPLVRSFLSQIVLPGEENIRRERLVGEGVKHIFEFHQDGPYLINVLTVDLTQPTIHLEAEKGKDALFQGEKVEEMAAREIYEGHRVIAAVNADFYKGNFRPVGLFVDEGMIFTEPHPNRAAFLVDRNGEPYIHTVSMSTVVKTASGEISVDAINPTEHSPDTVELYTPPFGSSTGTDADRTEVEMEMLGKEFIPNMPCQARIVAVRENQGNSPLAPGRLVLSGSGTGKTIIEQYCVPGDVVTLLASIPQVPGPVVMAVGGTPRLLSNGKVDINIEEERINRNFATDKHPRTAVGFDKAKTTLYLVAVDGRQPLVSIGINLYSLAEYLRELGADEAINLDGGGSTTMWIRGEVTNKPSDRGGSRTVSNSILVISTQPTGPLHRIELFPTLTCVPPNVSVKFSVEGYDQYYNPVTVKPEAIRWYTTKGLGTINSMGVLHTSTSSAEGSVMARIPERGLHASTGTNVRPAARLEVDPSLLLLTTGEQRSLSYKAYDATGRKLFVTNDMLNSAAPDCVKWEPDILTLTGLEKGKGELMLALEWAGAKVPVYVDMYKTEVIESFDTLPPGEAKEHLTGQRYDPDKTLLSLDRDLKKQGEAATRLTYSMQHGGTSLISRVLNAPIPGEPQKLALWVYGDGKEQWLRGELKDRDGEAFLIDFTEGAKGINWKDTWQYIQINRDDIVPKWTNPAARLDFPITFVRFYLVQAREAKKSDGSILLDSLEAIYPPEVD